MWKHESPDVRAKYQQKAQEIKAHLMALHPTYRYAPRKSSEIRRRAPRRPRLQAFEHNPHQSAQVNNEKAGIRPNSDITRRISASQRFLPPVVEPGWTPDHLLPNAATEQTLAGVETLVEQGLDMDGDLAYPTVEELMLDLEADIARILTEI